MIYIRLICMPCFLFYLWSINSHIVKKSFKYLSIAIATIVILFLAAAIIIPALYKDKIIVFLKDDLNKNIDADVEFGKINLSLFRHFPHLSVRIHDLSIRGKEQFAKDTLLAAKEIDLVLDLQKALKGDYDIIKFSVSNPRVHAIELANGKKNWNIFAEKPEDNGPKTNPAHFNITLRKYEIKHAFIHFESLRNGVDATIADLSHEGSGDFRKESFMLKTKTKVDGITVLSGKIPYCSGLKTSIDLNFGVDNRTKTYSFDTKDIAINGLNLAVKGSVQFLGKKKTKIDIRFNTPSNDFKDILSLLPGIYKDNFKNIKTSGTAAISGNVKGVMGDGETPAFNIDLEIKNGMLQYPDLPQPVTNVHLKLDAHNDDGIPDHTIINLDNGHLEFGLQPIDFHFILKNPVSGQEIEAGLKGKMDLSKLNQFVHLDSSVKLTGFVDADLFFKGSITDAQNQNFDALDASGSVSIQNLTFKSDALPDVAYLNNLKLSFTPQNISVSNLDAKFLNTNITGDGSLNNLLGYYLHNGMLTGAIHIKADHIDGNDWKDHFMKPRPKETRRERREERRNTEDTAHKAQPFQAPAHLNITLDAAVDEIVYDRVKITDVSGTMIMGDEIITLKDVKAHALEGAVDINGHYATLTDKNNPDLYFEYVVSLGRLVILRRHVDHL